MLNRKQSLRDQSWSGAPNTRSKLTGEHLTQKRDSNKVAAYVSLLKLLFDMGASIPCRFDNMIFQYIIQYVGLACIVLRYNKLNFK